MIKVRKSDEIYSKEGGWFSARWHFSFDEYYDPDNMGFGTMRVFNDDRLVPGAIWPMHPHRNIEGLTYVAAGHFRHADSLGNGGVFQHGAVQRMTLGSGANHSEQNGSETEPVRFIQIWIMPNEQNLPPGVEQKQFTEADRTNTLLRAIGPDREGGSVLVHQDASMYLSRLEAGKSVEHAFRPDFGGYLYVMDGGPVTLNGTALEHLDAAMIWQEPGIRIEARQTAELIMMEVRVR
ncbi:MAG TPA: pirin family protein [Dehalococcoidia bacterium]|nr:pirin family protein [Dehalococcoidia bacterium]